jgi:hypothetical protein
MATGMNRLTACFSKKNSDSQGTRNDDQMIKSMNIPFLLTGLIGLIFPIPGKSFGYRTKRAVADLSVTAFFVT